MTRAVPPASVTPTVLPGASLVHPAVLTSLALLLLNDHVFKAAAVGTPWSGVTGKLSDVAGLAFFPVLVVASLELLGLRRRLAWSDRRLASVVAVVVAAVFATINLWPAAGDLYALTLGALQWPARALVAVLGGMPSPSVRPVQHVVDPTDCLALPATALVVWLSRRS